MKYMILVYASQRDYDAMVGKPAPGEPGWSGADFAALGQFVVRRPDRRGHGTGYRGAAARAAGPIPGPGGWASAARRPGQPGGDGG